MLVSYWLLLASGTRSVAVTHWLFLTLLAVPSIFVLGRGLVVRENRAVFAVLGVGLTLWTLGTAWHVIADIRGEGLPLPSVADVLWLTMYPCAFVAVTLLARTRLGRPSVNLVLDSVMVIMVLGAALSTVILPPVLANAGGLSPLAQLVNVAYPIGDTILVAVAITSAVFVGWHNGRIVTFLGLAAVALMAANTLGELSAGEGAWQPLGPSNALYLLGPTLIAVAALLPARVRGRLVVHGGEVRVLATVLGAVVVAIGLLVANEWTDVGPAAVVLAALSLLVAINRTAVSLTEGVRASRALGRRAAMVDDVRRGLGAGELLLHFQPLLTTLDGKVCGAEALLRWQCDGALVAPNDFLPIVEQSELMGPLTDFVIDEALGALAGWRRDGHDIGVSVNLAVRNLSDLDLASRVGSALDRHRVTASALTLEVTETAPFDDNKTAVAVMQALRDLGVELSIDDFGTGHSSLARIAMFRVDELKIDRSFVKGLGTVDRPIVWPTVQAAHTMGVRVVAEGVETSAALNALKTMGCDIVQGYFISRPLPANDFKAWLATNDPPALSPTDTSADHLAGFA